jgi:hypothetical protein
MGQADTKTVARAGVLEQALRKLNEEVIEGLQHGFFELTITCELINDRKRSVTIKFGKSHRFVLAETDL